MDLPQACDRCRGAAHVIGANGGAVRCDCERGRELQALDKERRNNRGSMKAVQAKRAKEAANARKRVKDTSMVAANDREPELFEE